MTKVKFDSSGLVWQKVKKQWTPVFNSEKEAVKKTANTFPMQYYKYHVYKLQDTTELKNKYHLYIKKHIQNELRQEHEKHWLAQ